MLRKVLTIFVGATLLGLLAACAGQPLVVTEVETVEVQTEVEVEKEVVVTATPEPVEQVIIGGFDVGPGGAPQAVLYMSGAGHIWYSKLFTPLVMMNSDFSEFVGEGGLAESWEANDDFTEWTFNLREGVQWHDGEPFTAQDLKFTLEFTEHPDSPATFPVSRYAGAIAGMEEYKAGEADEITGVVAVDDTTLQINLAQPNPRLFAELRWFYALPEHAIDFEPAELDSSDWWWSRPVGTGPFKFARYEKDQFMELAANELYWDGRPKLDRLINRYFADETAAVLALSSGDIDFSYISADVATRFEDDERYDVFSGPSFVTNVYNYNYNRDVWNDVRVRQAIMHGIDREAIIRDVFGGTALAAPCHDPYPTYWPEDANYYDYDPAKAQELLAEAAADGVDVSGLEFAIPTYYTSELAKDILTVQQANLADVGLNVVPTFLDVLTWRQVVNNDQDFDIAYRGNGASPLAYEMDIFYQTEDNFFGLNDPEYDRLLGDMNAAETFEDYKAGRTALCKYQNEQASHGYWWVSTRYGVADSGLEDFYFFPAPGGGPYVDNSHLWSKAE
jgi:peptide/nickel transport system substrate-binding protein